MTELEQAIAKMVRDMVQEAVDKLTSPDRLYSAEDLAERYHRSPATIAGWIRAGLFGETINPDSKGRLVTMEGIRMYDAAHKGPAHTPAEEVVPKTKRKPRQSPGKI